MKKPNILFVFADQLRYTAVGCSGNRVVRTPNIDQLGREGMIMDRAFSSCPICSPYRAQLLTGNYSHVNGVVCNEYRLFDNQQTIADYLKPHGYQTTYVGKWHLGFAPYIERMRHGFDDLIAFNSMAGYFDISYFRNEDGPFPMGGYEVTVETDLAIEYMRKHTNPDRPWCVIMSCQAPHSTGLHYGSRYRDFPQEFGIYDEDEIQLSDNVPLPFRDFTRKELTGYYGMVTSIDWNIGRLMAELERLGIADETIVCFSSDHGDHVHAHGMGHPSDSWAHHSMRGAKATPYDESIHIPFVIRYPDKIKPLQRSGAFLNSVDVLPTFLELCDVDVPDTIQGVSIAPHMIGEDQQTPDSVYLQILGPGWPTRDKWLGLWRGVRTTDYVYARWFDLGGQRMLFDLNNDPAEMKNLIDDPDSAAIAEEMEGRLQSWLKCTGDPFDTGKRLPVTEMLDLGQAFDSARWLQRAPAKYAEAVKDNHLNFKTGEQPDDPRVPQR